MSKNKITAEEIKNLAKLSRIEITENEMENYQKNLDEVMKLMDDLKKVNTTDVKPMVGVSDLCQELRKDEVIMKNTKEDVLLNAKDRVLDFYVVPKVID